MLFIGKPKGRLKMISRRYLSRYEDMDDDDDEMGHFYTGLSDTRGLAHIPGMRICTTRKIRFDISTPV